MNSSLCMLGDHRLITHTISGSAELTATLKIFSARKRYVNPTEGYLIRQFSNLRASLSRRNGRKRTLSSLR